MRRNQILVTLRDSGLKQTLNVAATDSFWRVMCLIAARCSSFVLLRSDFSRSNLYDYETKKNHPLTTTAGWCHSKQVALPRL